MSNQIVAPDGDHFLKAFACTVGSPVENGRVVIPESYGNGYVMGVLFGNYLRLIVRHYSLHDDLLIKRQSFNVPDTMIQIAISGILKEDQPVAADVQHKTLPSVAISTQGLDSELHIPRGINFNLIKLAVDPAYLRELLAGEAENLVVKTLIENRQPLVFEELVSLRLQEIVLEMISTQVPVSLQRFYYKVKAEELICCLLMELTKRQDHSLHSINAADLKALYTVRDQLIGNLAQAPPLVELAKSVGMSLSKLKRLFKQVFGCGPYSYYQTRRMKEAASLLQDNQRSVSEVGYALGFSNLSHFSRVFEEHVGMKPKKFSSF
ncbi:helix-turn-helix transcriptional regulator [Dyadobacter subterraneus]|uniref:Helix-turn-helix transcriptional regulator n=1 Tax=Dyadobacter subterraneus TaxID=2773304 RepID=A0ABR9WE82_9BACT|nr:AraC family transcriptional regulator [Dyadobacter subterraneus]MBE9463807.1 helix-turn-helix transcriptional regulator [Dyadobacter subterraneus]